ncbi:mechanosensitive ion channel family protein [Paraburkholderia caffeinilytica]|uniref:mechanosensitive ion channel family protein n=1 Tax=Paraburkholderia caffeinilytica TaxID=1761016 RepID=UPI003DA06B84
MPSVNWADIAAWPALQTSAARFGSASLILFIGWKLSSLCARGVRKGALRVHGDATLAPALGHATLWGVRILVVVAVLGQIGIQTASVLTVIGAAGLAIGLALQGTLQNIAAGIMLLLLRPTHVGDLIECDGLSGFGTTEEIGLFSTRIRRADGICVLIPNSKLWSGSVVNYSRNPQRRIEFVVGIRYGDNVAAALDALRTMVCSHRRVLQDPEPISVVTEYAESSVNLLVRAWVLTPDYWPTKWALLLDVQTILSAANCSMAFPVRDVQLTIVPSTHPASTTPFNSDLGATPPEKPSQSASTGH